MHYKRYFLGYKFKKLILILNKYKNHVCQIIYFPLLRPALQSLPDSWTADPGRGYRRQFWAGALPLRYRGRDEGAAPQDTEHRGQPQGSRAFMNSGSSFFG